MLKTMLMTFAIVGYAATALAENICRGGPRDQWLGEAEISQRVKALGHTDFHLSIEDGCIEATVETPEGEVEYYFEPITGDVAKIKKT